jgi:hypothetical protein
MAENNSGTPTEVEFTDLDELLGTTAATVIVPESTKPTVFTDNKTDLSFLDKPEDEEDEDGNIISPKGKVTKDVLAAVLDDEEEDELDDDNTPSPTSTDNSKNPVGRPTLSKDALVEATNKLIEKGILQPFDDGKPLTEYTVADFEELIEANLSEKVNKVAQDAPIAVFSQLPEEVQQVITYALNGGKDIKNILKTVAQTQETLDLSLDNEQDQERIVREYYRSINFGTDEEIEDEINSLADRNEIQKKAELFKPKLDAKQAEIMQNKLAEQEKAKQRAEAAAKNYQDTIYSVLAPGELNGIKLDNKVQNMLYYGLTDSTQYQDKNGTPTTKFGHLIEEYQYGKNPNPSLIAEALWLLSDPEGYRNNLKNVGQQNAAKETYRSLKSAEATRTQSSSVDDDTRKTAPVKRTEPSIQRKNRSVFSRS